MKYLLLVSHGDFAEGLKTSLAMFAQDKMDQVLAVGLKDGQSADDFSLVFKDVISTLNKEDSILLLADIVGGSPLTTALNVLEMEGKLENTTVLGGMNLPMALTGAVMKDVLEKEALVETLLSETKNAILEFKTSSNNEDDEDDI